MAGKDPIHATLPADYARMKTDQLQCYQDWDAINQEMQYSGTGLSLTERFEGCKLTAYQDSGRVWTNGYGNTHGVVQHVTITQEQAIASLKDNIQTSVNDINRLVNAGNFTGAAAEFDKWDHCVQGAQVVIGSAPLACCTEHVCRQIEPANAVKCRVPAAPSPQPPRQRCHDHRTFRDQRRRSQKQSA
jgi:GH24 family phage-related lysozyme (muramidase)